MDTAKTLWVIALTAAAAAACAAFYVERVEINAAIVRGVASRHWHFSKWLTAFALMQWTTGNLFFIAARALLGASAVGALRAAQNLMGVLHILFRGLENVVVPTAGALYKRKGSGGLTEIVHLDAGRVMFDPEHPDWSLVAKVFETFIPKCETIEALKAFWKENSKDLEQFKAGSRDKEPLIPQPPNLAVRVRP